MVNMLTQINRELARTLTLVDPRIIKDWHLAAKTTATSKVQLHDSVILSNFVSKFEEPDTETRERLHQEAQAAFLETNATLIRPCDRVFSDGNGYLLAQLRQDMLEFSKHVYLDPNDFWFGPGVNLSTKASETSMPHKALSEITCYPHQVELAVNTLLSIRAYRRYFREKFCILPGVSKLEQLAELRKCVRDNLIVVPGNRFDTVDKNNSKRRPIAVEASFAVCYQRMIMLGLVRAIKSYYGVDITQQAELHQQFILDPSNATLDESDASNSIHVEDPGFIGLPRWLTSAMRLAAPMYTLVRVGDAKGYVKSNICSTMGCGFTFPLLTLVNLSAARLFDKNASAFGDDVVIKSTVAESFIRFMTTVFNFKFNAKKSFISNDRARESCGAYVVDDVPVRAYSVKWLSEMTEIIPTMNKILYMADTVINPYLKQEMFRLHARLVQIFRTKFRCGPRTSGLLVDLEFAVDPAWAPEPGNVRTVKRIADKLCYPYSDVFRATTISFLTKKTSINCIRDRRLVMVPLRGATLAFEKRGYGSVSQTTVVFHRASGHRLT